MTRHQYGISALVPQTPFRGESGGLEKCVCFLRLPDRKVMSDEMETLLENN